MKKRLFEICRIISVLFILGIAYAFVCQKTGIGIPCLFRKVTKLYCPGCGITHMCMDLLQFKFKEAFISQPAVFCLMPVGAIIAIRWGIRYVRDATKDFTKGEESVLIVILVILIGFCIFRNIRYLWNTYVLS